MKRTTNRNGFFLFLGNDENATNFYQYRRLSVDIGGCGPGDINRLITDIFINENEPIYITYTYDPNAETEKGILYINGVKTQTTEKGNIENLISLPANTPIQIGSDVYGTYLDRKYPFYGEIYASRVYNRPLTENEVEYNYNTTVKNKTE